MSSLQYNIIADQGLMISARVHYILLIHLVKTISRITITTSKDTSIGIITLVLFDLARTLRTHIIRVCVLMRAQEYIIFIEK